MALRVPMLLGAGAVVRGAKQVPGGEERTPAWAGGVSFSSKLVIVVQQLGQPDRPGRQVGADLDPGGGELVEQSLVRGGLGAVLTDPLSLVVDVVPAVQGVEDP